MIDKNNVILFQGDSITDVGRVRQREGANDSAALGRGYAMLIAGNLLQKYAEENLKIYNRGVGGDRVVSLLERWQEDSLKLNPDLLSILIGVNDTWRGQDGRVELHVPVDKYEQIFRKLLVDTKKANNNITLVLCEPFVLPCGAVTDSWFPEFNERRAVVKDLAKEFGAIFVPFQQAFDDACKRAAPDYWALDGVHPTIAGHQLMAQTWLDTVSSQQLSVSSQKKSRARSESWSPDT